MQFKSMAGNWPWKTCQTLSGKTCQILSGEISGLLKVLAFFRWNYHAIKLQMEMITCANLWEKVIFHLIVNAILQRSNDGSLIIPLWQRHVDCQRKLSTLDWHQICSFYLHLRIQCKSFHLSNYKGCWTLNKDCFHRGEYLSDPWHCYYLFAATVAGELMYNQGLGI